MWQTFRNVFSDLLRKASTPIQQPKPVVPATQQQQPPSLINESDRVNHNTKIHYQRPHEANTVVQRSYFQNPQKHKGIHYYKCPVCEHEHGKTQYIVGHSNHAGIPAIPSA